MPMPDIAPVLADLDGLAIETQPQRVRRRSRDFYWYSPILKRELDHVTADAVVTPRDEAEVLRVMRACSRHRVPLTARGGGTGNYGQAMPLRGGIVIDLSELSGIREIGLGRVRAGAGAKLCDIDAACQAHPLRQELRIHPSTHKTGTIGGYVAGGSSGVGSITWGLLRDRGNILGLRVLTMEEEPRRLELRGDAIQKVNHAYGTNGIITEVEMPLAPAHAWRELILAFDDFMTAVRFADALSREDALLKKLVTPIAAPVGHRYLRPEQLGPADHCVLLMIAEIALEAFREMAAGWPCRTVWDVPMAELPKAQPPLFEYSWNHTTLNALKVDRGITYLQTLFPPPDHVALVERMYRHYGDEVPMHLEFVHFAGEVACFGLQLVRYTSDARLMEIIDEHNAAGCPIFNPHDYTLEGGGMKKVDQRQLAFKREADPLNLLNPGKMRGWDDPAYDASEDRRFLYER
jgi:FAD/FMN-containing dehydrogenase